MTTAEKTELDYYKEIVAKSLIEITTKITEFAIYADLPYKVRMEFDTEHPDIEKFMHLHYRKPD